VGIRLAALFSVATHCGFNGGTALKKCLPSQIIDALFLSAHDLRAYVCPALCFIWMEFDMKKLLMLAALLLGLIVGSGPVAAAPTREPSPNQPDILDLEGTFAAGDACAFAVQFEVTGKFKIIQTPTERTITTSPGQTITLTNVSDPTKTVTYVITGVRFETKVQTKKGTVLEVVNTGINLAVNGADQKSTRPGLFLLVGNFNFAVTDTNPQREVRVFSGDGQVIDVCAALA
jgi:hypothetical protein